MATRDKPKAPAASKKSKNEKREQGDAPQPVGKPVEPETPVAQESSEPLEPPENWGSPFKPTMDTRMVRVLQEATLLLEMGMEEEMGNRDILVMPEFVNRLLWIRRQAECGKPLTPREGEKIDAAWDRLKSSAVAYISSKFSDEWRDIFEDYDYNTTVSESIMPLPALTARDGGLAYIVSKSITDFKECCRLVATARNSYDNIVPEVYDGRHEVSGDGNLYWGERWLCEPDKWTKFHETFQKRCAELQEPMEAPAVGTVAPEAGERETEKKRPRSKRQSAHSGKGVTQIQLVKLLKEENLFYEQSTISKWEHGRGTPEGYPGRDDAVALKAWIGRFAEGVRMKKAMAKMVSYNDSVDYSRKRDDR